MKKLVLIFCLLVFSFLSLFADTGANIADSEGKLNYFELIVGPSLSALCIGLSILEDAYFGSKPPSIEGYYIDRLTIAGAHIPAILSSPLEGGLLLSLSASQWITAELTSGEFTAFFKDFIWSHPSHLAMFSTYTAYRVNRLKADPELYSKNWRDESILNNWISRIDFLKDFQRSTQWQDYSFLDLSLATLNPENFLDPMILPIFIGFFIPFFQNSHDYAFWNQNRAFVGTLKLDPLIATPLMGIFFLFESIIIAVTEEAHFRGFIYEEMGSNFGSGMAKIFDSIYFPSIHIPTDLLLSQYDLKQSALHFLQRSALTLYLDFLYDRGGLPLSTTAHMLIDFTLFFSSWLLISGIPHADISSMLKKMLPLSLEYRIPL
ncbi:MAG: CPBP family intramembrane metalloprotease [Spirochaetales bacterium]|nr:CPBP family intramembrane metalloprotease [Spirochaetales bacterium]